jgi:hypothetical protein
VFATLRTIVLINIIIIIFKCSRPLIYGPLVLTNSSTALCLLFLFIIIKLCVVPPTDPRQLFHYLYSLYNLLLIIFCYYYYGTTIVSATLLSTNFCFPSDVGKFDKVYKHCRWQWIGTSRPVKFCRSTFSKFIIFYLFIWFLFSFASSAYT